MGLFDKKFCDVCGKKIGLFGNRKLEDGNLCSDCAKLLSPFFSDRRSSTVEEIKEQLAYREANKEKAAAFNSTKVIGGDTKILFDEDKKQWIVTRSRKWRDENPDVMDFSQVTGCSLDVDERRDELKRRDDEGNEVSFNPPRYEYYYDFYLTIHVNSPWFTEIRFQINDEVINQRGGITYRETQAKADEIRATLTQARDTEREAAVTAKAPKTSVICPHCQATTTPDAGGCCEYCGAPVSLSL
jgi:hypothetical protein